MAAPGRTEGGSAHRPLTAGAGAKAMPAGSLDRTSAYSSPCRRCSTVGFASFGWARISAQKRLASSLAIPPAPSVLVVLIRLRLDRLHVLVGEAEMVSDL